MQWITDHLAAVAQSVPESHRKAFVKNGEQKMLWDGIVRDGFDGSSDNAIEVHIHNLRKKAPKVVIKNIRGVGYILERSREGQIDDGSHKHPDAQREPHKGENNNQNDRYSEWIEHQV